LRQSRQLIGCQEVPVPLLPCGGKTLIAFEACLCQPQQRTIGDEQAHHFTVRRHLRVAPKEKRTEWERSQLHLTHQEALAAAEEEHINLVERGTIGPVAQWWRGFDRISCHLSAERESANKQRFERWGNCAVKPHRRTDFQQRRNTCKSLIRTVPTWPARTNAKFVLNEVRLAQQLREFWVLTLCVTSSRP
jgi:hypothetical protein